MGQLEFAIEGTKLIGLQLQAVYVFVIGIPQVNRGGVPGTDIRFFNIHIQGQYNAFEVKRLSRTIYGPISEKMYGCFAMRVLVLVVPVIVIVILVFIHEQPVIVMFDIQEE